MESLKTNQIMVIGKREFNDFPSIVTGVNDAFNHFWELRQSNAMTPGNGNNHPIPIAKQDNELLLNANDRRLARTFFNRFWFMKSSFNDYCYCELWVNACIMMLIFPTER